MSTSSNRKKGWAGLLERRPRIDRSFYLKLSRCILPLTVPVRSREMKGVLNMNVRFRW